MTDKVDTESFAQLERLRELRVSHRDLDYLIDRLQDDPMVDQLRIRRLKKRKLVLKDMIANLEKVGDHLTNIAQAGRDLAGVRNGS